MGATKVYAAARNPESVTLNGVVTLKLDVTSDEDAVAAERVAGNVNLLVNNAGIARPSGFLADGRSRLRPSSTGDFRWHAPDNLAHAAKLVRNLQVS